MSAGGGRRAASWSITARLAVLFTLSACVTLGIATALLLVVLTESLEKDDFQLLADKVYWLRANLREHPDDRDFLRLAVQVETGAARLGSHNVFFTRVLDRYGRILVETPDMEPLLTPPRFPTPAPAGQPPTLMTRWNAPDGRSYQLMSAEATTGGAAAPRLLQVAMDDTLEEKLIADYRQISVAVLAIGTLLFAAIGVVIVRRSLQPLRDIARAAEQVTASRLAERVDPARWPEELKDLAHSFDLMLGRLDDSFGRLSRFSADLAHELRNPIHTLMGQTEVALSRDREAADYREVLQSNLEELNRLTRMINGLLFLARADHPDTQVELSALDARDEMDAVREFHEAQAEEKGVALNCEGQARLRADATLFRRALSNLVSNALRHTPPGGQVTLAARQDGGSTLVTVRDTGPGIAPEHLPRIFDRFYRPDRMSLHNPDGTGLGLAIVKSIMDLHRGSVTVSSDPARGTLFTLQFPPGDPETH
ncbi:MAG TPA: heavy metal sensor histidine kinase [Burkholderiales bacterium]|nr:heavy metal sensor histidine kinase [Burkholderiales bacterium]